MPCDLMDSGANGMQRMAFANNAVAQTYMLRHNSNNQIPAKLPPSQNSVEDDSDEEHFPPPPEVVVQRTPTPQQAQMVIIL